MKIIRFFLIICGVIGMSVSASAAINVLSPDSINSGNPSMPFPQFADYAGGASLASHQPDGVSHAEMEKWLREAYQIMANRFYTPPAPFVNTITYYDSSGAPQNIPLFFGTGSGLNSSSCSDGSIPGCAEGVGYSLLIAAIMGDKKTFDGLWFGYVENNDLLNATKYSDGTFVARGKNYGNHYIPDVPGGDSATDGDFDIAMGCLIAYKQWGPSTGYFAKGGHGPNTIAVGGNTYKEIMYRDIALGTIRFLVERAEGDNPSPYNVLIPGSDDRWRSGDVGFDGYHNSGNTWNEATTWAQSCPASPYCPAFPDSGGSGSPWFDYTAPSYWRNFVDFLTTNADLRDSNTLTGGWSNINQLQRAAASDAWLIGQLMTKPGVVNDMVGKYTVNNDGSATSFTNQNWAEDFRAPWRHGLDYLWNKNPNFSWDPVIHQINAAPNSYEYQAAQMNYNFLKNDISCVTWGSSPISYNGMAGVLGSYNMNGTGATTFHLNWGIGAFVPSVMVMQDFDMMGDMFRELMIEWDLDAPGDHYLTSVPFYFHDFFRVIGLLIITGNHISPNDWHPQANMKVYKAINKTYAFAGDTLTYWINYRNFGSVDATGVMIRDTLPSDFAVLNTSNPMPFAVGGNAYEWNIGGVPGLHNQNYNATEGGVTLVVQVKNTAALTKFCNTADIRCNNGTGWTSNDIPNDITETCETNCVDIVAAALTITKTASKALANPGDTLTYTLDYCNSSNAGWIEGGRFGVNFSFAVGAVPGTADSTLTFLMRAIHEAAEPVINWQNYRISYFLNSSYHGLAGVDPGGQWNVDGGYDEGFGPGIQPIVSFEDLVPGTDTNVPGTGATGSWNQRMIFQFGPSRTEPTHELYIFNTPGSPRIHFGDAQRPVIIERTLHAGNATQNWTDDWSQQTAASVGAQTDPLWPISPDWTDGIPSTPGVPVWKINKNECTTLTHNIQNVLVEEWDGYTWRRVFGNGPQPGRQVNNVIVTDSLPSNVTFGNFIGTAGTQSGRTLQWTTPSMLINECNEAKYWVTVNNVSCPAPDSYADNIAFVSADKESPVSAANRVTITCSILPTPTPFPSSLTKTANASVFNTGDTVTYSINYSNFYGSIIDDLLNSATGWTKQSGSADLTFGGGKAQSQNGTAVRTFNNSMGINGIIIAKLHIESYATFGIAFKHTGGAVTNGYYVTFKPNYDSTAALKIWNGTTELTACSQNINVGKAIGAPADFDVKLDVEGTQLRIYIDPSMTQTWPVLPDVLCTLPAAAALQSGNAGLINGDPLGGDASNNAHYASLWHTELDTSINTRVFDSVPTGVSYLGGDNSSSLISNIVVWPPVAIMNHGASLLYKWWAKITGGCQNITNTAQVIPQGILTPILAATVIRVNCGATTPTITPTISTTNTMTQTPTATPTGTLSVTQTNTGTVTCTSTSTNTATSTQTVSPSQTITQTATQILISATVTQTLTVSSTQTLTQSPTQTQTVTPTITLTNTQTMTPSTTCTSSVTPAFTFTVTQTNSPTLTITTTNTQTSTPTSTMTITPSPTISPVYSLTDTLTATATGTPSATSTWSPTSTGTRTITNTSTPTASPSASSTFTGTPTVTYTNTASPTPSVTKTPTGTRTITPTMTGTFTRTASPTITPSATVTLTPAPSPVDMQITLNASGDNPKPGSKITYDITIRNPENRDATNINIWDTLPAGCVITGVISPSPYTYQMNGDVISWDFGSLDLGPAGGADEITVEYTVEITDINAARNPADGLIHNTASVNYNDPAYPAPGTKHPPLKSDLSLYPTGRPVVFPNPFNPKTAKGGTLKFANMVPGSVIQIFTISGEAVAAITAQGTNVTWDGKNSGGGSMSAGIYYFVITNKTTNTALKGKLFVVNN